MEGIVDRAGPGAIGKGSQIEVARSLYDRLTIEQDEGLAWLVGTGAEVTRAGEAAWEIITLDLSLFCSLHNLVSESPQWELTGEAALFSDAWTDAHPFSAWVSPEDTLDWCTAHGLPFVENYRDMPEGQLAERLRVRTFQQETVMLYLLYQLWDAVQNPDQNGLDRYLTPFLPNPALIRELKHWRRAEKTSLAQEQLHRLITLYTRRVHLSLTPYGAGPPKLLWRTSSLFSVAHLELALLMTQHESHQRVKPCRGCLRLFAGHGNGRYCANCDRRTIWSRKKHQPAATP
jgi:hypothetical protein